MVRRPWFVFPLVFFLAVTGCDNPLDTAADTFRNCPVEEFAVPGTVQGSLGADSCLLVYGGSAQDRYVAYHEVRLGHAGPLDVSLMTDDFDAYIIVWSRSNQGIVAEEAGGGVGTGARLVQTVPAGRYIIGATTVGEEETGAYTLRVN
jgi:hypothetical protein